jgi:hypothetical protein
MTGRQKERHLSPASFARYLQSSAPIEHPIPGEPRLVLFIDPTKSRIGLRGPARPNEHPSPSGLQRLTVQVVYRDGGRMIEVAVTDPRLFEDAFPVLCAVADRVQLAGRPMGVALTETLRRLGHLLSPEDDLPRDVEISLLGELCTLAGIARAIDAPTALSAWRGAAGEEHDFGLELGDLEVKSTTSERRAHWISSLTQLVPTAPRPLWLMSFQVTSAGTGGTTLARLVARVRDLFTDESSRRSFDEQLHMVGWQSRHASKGEHRRWRLRSPPCLYEVTASFPRLTPDMLSSAGVALQHITDVNYRLDLTDLPAATPSPPLSAVITYAQKELT